MQVREKRNSTSYVDNLFSEAFTCLRKSNPVIMQTKYDVKWNQLDRR